MSLARASLAPFGSALAAGLMLVTLALAASSGQQATIAGYGLGVSVAGIVGALVAGGTSLAYAAGNLQEQRAVRKLRTFVLTPISVTTVTALAAIVGAIGDLTFSSIFAGGLSAIAVNLAEIELAYLRSRLEIPAIVLTDVSTRLLALVMVSIGVDFSLAVLLAMAMRLIALARASRRDPARRKDSNSVVGRQLSISRPLYIGNAAQILTDRAIFIIAPLALSTESAGLLATAMMAVQAISAVTTSAFQVTLSIRSQRGPAAWLKPFDLAIVGAATIAAAALVILYSQLATVGIAGLSHTAWLLVCAGLPLAVASRMVLFRLLAASARKKMATAQTMAAILAMLYFAIVAILGPSVERVAAAYVLIEGSTLTSATLLLWRRRQ